jgi:hypothetical protein
MFSCKDVKDFLTPHIECCEGRAREISELLDIPYEQVERMHIRTITKIWEYIQSPPMPR